MNQKPNMVDVLRSILEKPEGLPEYARAFHHFSIWNQMMAAFQLKAAGLPIAPIATLKQWNQKGRRVKPGSEAIWLSIPVKYKAKPQNEEEEEEERLGFKLVKRWFSVDQTEGEPFVPEDTPARAWDETRALHELSITRIPFTGINGTLQGYATGRNIAISPVSTRPVMVALHEIAHVVEGHTDQGARVDGDILSREECEIEAECTAYLVGHMIGVPESVLAESRYYVHAYGLTPGALTTQMVKRIMAGVSTIYNAGAPPEKGSDDVETRVAA